jgi:Cupin-like domain
MERYLHAVLDELSIDDQNDRINECECAHLSQVAHHCEELLQLADQKLHVYPFKEVRPCWFRLYTDASLAKAVKLSLSHLRNADDAANPGDGDAWIDEVVAVLDMALIMAGGLGREAKIHGLLNRLQQYTRSRYEDKSISKRRRIDEGSDSSSAAQAALLPQNTTSVPKLRYPLCQWARPSLEVFQQHMNTQKEPVILTGIFDHWPALDSWKYATYWHHQTFGGRRLVPVELGRSYVDEDWGQKIMTFKDFMANHIVPTPADVATKEIQTGYLAQHDLLKQIPSLHTAITTPDYCYLEAPPPDPGTPVALSEAKTQKTSHPILLPTANKDSVDSNADDIPDVQANIWFGPAWTITPLHHDPYHNILCQVVGKKYIRLYSPHVSSKLYPRSSTEPAPHLRESGAAESAATIDMSNTSLIDVAAMELSPDEDWDATYPGISEVPYVECVLEAGRALYIPVGWWHYVRSCSVGISVSFWW